MCTVFETLLDFSSLKFIRLHVGVTPFVTTITSTGRNVCKTYLFLYKVYVKT